VLQNYSLVHWWFGLHWALVKGDYNFSVRLTWWFIWHSNQPISQSAKSWFVSKYLFTVRCTVAPPGLLAPSSYCQLYNYMCTVAPPGLLAPSSYCQLYNYMCMGKSHSVQSFFIDLKIVWLNKEMWFYNQLGFSWWPAMPADPVDVETL